MTVAGMSVYQNNIRMTETSEIDFRGADVIFSITGTDVMRVRHTSCTGTGGLPKYDTCITSNPLSSSGVITEAFLDLQNVPFNTAVTADCGFTKGLETGSGVELANDHNVYGTGGLLAVFTGTTIWNGADYLKCALSVDPTASFTATLRTYYHDVLGQ